MPLCFCLHNFVFLNAPPIISTLGSFLNWWPLTQLSTFNSCQFLYHNNDIYTNYSISPPFIGSFLNEENLFSSSWDFNPGLFSIWAQYWALSTYSLRLDLQWSFLELRRKVSWEEMGPEHVISNCRNVQRYKCPLSSVKMQILGKLLR